ncbi:MAG: sulfate adenylyltransferase, partial [Candidatus Latescibacterota bacterium]|nr:sulfate adenylyltransferase [Candidatus Latescibacterota bacterium]
MINPHGADELKPLYVEDDAARSQLAAAAGSLPSIPISSGAAASAVMLGSGYFTPLDGFMNLADAKSVAADMKTGSGLLWPTPVVNIVPADQSPDGLGPGSRIALKDPNVDDHPVIAIQEATAIEVLADADRDQIISQVFGTDDEAHPGVAAFKASGDTLIAGPIQVLNFSYFPGDFPETFRTAVELRAEIAERGWNRVVAFQTRNPMHRAHEELCRMAQAAVNADGILIHMLLGKLKPGDIPADVRDASIRKMVELYFPENTVMIAGYGFDMLYAGPREAVLHAIFRQNSGCSHLIVGRDHAGVGDYYGAFDAQTVFDGIGDDALEIEIFRGDHTVWCKSCNEVVMMRDCPHEGDDYLFLSGTQVREMLATGEALPPEFARPEVAEILSGYYQQEAAT